MVWLIGSFGLLSIGSWVLKYPWLVYDLNSYAKLTYELKEIQTIIHNLFS